MKKNKILLILTLIFLSSCNLVLKTLYGVKKPKIETEKSLKDYLKRKGINADNIYAVNKDDYVKIIKQIKNIPEILVFDKNGNNIKYKETKQCNAKAFDFIETLSKNTSFIYNDSLKLNDYLKKLKDFSGNPVKYNKKFNTDFYLFIFWTRYIGRLNKDHVKVWETKANNNKNAKIEVIKVNLDQQKWWK